MTYVITIIGITSLLWSLLKIANEIKQLRRYLEYIEYKQDDSTKAEMIDELISLDTTPPTFTTSVNTGNLPLEIDNKNPDADTLGAIPPMTELDEMIDKALKDTKPIRDNDRPKPRMPKLEKLKNFNGVKAYKKTTPTIKKTWFNIAQGDILRVTDSGELITVQAINKRGNRKYYLCLNKSGVQCTYKREQLEQVKD